MSDGFDESMLGGVGYSEDDQEQITVEDDDLPDVFDGLELTGDLEVDSANELRALQQGFRDRERGEQLRNRIMTSSSYWCCLVFATQEQKDAFLLAMGWRLIGGKYLDGQRVAAASGIELPAAPEFSKHKKEERTTGWAAMAAPLPGSQA